MSRLIRRYSELIKIPTFEERYEYLRLAAKIGEKTFGYERYLNQHFYTSTEWRKFRRDMIIRDKGCDLAMDDYDIHDVIELHHINAITIEDIENNADCLMDPENVICTSGRTHKAIHYGDVDLLPKGPVIRRPNDMCPWRD